MTDYSKYSFWLETSGDDLSPRPALSGSAEADVVILGAGYTGLWAAYYLLKANPHLTQSLSLKKRSSASALPGVMVDGVLPNFP